MCFAEENPEPNKNPVTLPFSFVATARRNSRLTIIAENIETKTPRRNVIANPRTNESEKIENKMIAVMILEKFESRIESHARSNPAVIPSSTVRPPRSSSLIRSKISTLASTAIPIEIINPAIAAEESVTCRTLNTASVTIT